MTVAGLVVIVAGLITRTAQAGPLTNQYGEPFTKIGVYQGVITIIPGGATDSVMEFGNAGREIASTGDIFLRPGAMQPTYTSPSDTFPNNIAYIYKDSGSGKANFSIPSGQICLGTLSNCRSAWSAGGASDPNWQVAGSPSNLQPTDGNNGIRIGTFTNPIPSSSGQAGEIYANYAGSAVQVTKRITTGYDPGSGNYVGGSTLVNGNYQVRYPTLYSYGYTYAVVPWNAENDNYGGVDADTFDGTTNLPFTKASHAAGNYHDLFWKDIETNTGSNLEYLCLHTPDNQLCVGGSNAGGTCSQLCVGGSNAGGTCSSAGDCPGGTCSSAGDCPGGTCSQLCSAQAQICAKDPEPGVDVGQGHCANNNSTSCTYNDDCGPPGTDFCLYGDLLQYMVLYQGLPISCDNSRCNTECSARFKCQGTQDPSCSFTGSSIHYNTGSCGQSACSYDGNTNNFTCSCDCRLTNDKTFYNSVAGQGADICTENFN